MKKGKLHYAWVILIACILVQIGTLGGIGYSVGIYYRPISAELGVGRGQLALYHTLQSTVSALMSPFVGRFLPGKNMGKKMALAMAGLTVGYCMMSTYTQLWQWYITAALMGLCSAFLYLIPVPLLISSWFHKGTGTAMGIAMCSGVGGTIMTQIGTRVIAASNWRNAYLVIGGLCAAIVIPTCLLLIKSKPEEMGLKPYGAEEKEGAANAARPVRGVPYDVAVKSKVFVLLFITAGVMSFPSIYSNHLAAFAGSIGMSALQGANLASTMMMSSMLAKVVLGQMNDRMGAKNAAVAALAMMGVGFLMVVLFYKITPVLYVAVCLCSFGPGLMSVQPSMVSRSVFGVRDHSRIFSSITVAAALTSAWAVTIVGFIYDFAGSYIPAFALGASVCVLAVLMVLAVVKMGRAFRPYLEEPPA